MRIAHDRLKRLTSAIFAAAGSNAHEAERIGHYLTEANLVGHDSHGVIRISYYIDWVRAGKVLANQDIKIVFENDAIAVVDGQYGFGQTIGEQATKLGIEKSSKHGVAVIALRNTGHLGRIGDWPLLAARAGKVSLHFVNTSGAGILVAPFGGINRRLSANPIAAGVPVKGGSPILLDMSCCTIAEGKLKVAFNKGLDVADGCIIDSKGQATTDPRVFYGDPPGRDSFDRRTQGLWPGHHHRDAGRRAHRRRSQQSGQCRPPGQRHALDLHGSHVLSGRRRLWGRGAAFCRVGQKLRKGLSPTARS